jgi:hypothetical protein
MKGHSFSVVVPINALAPSVDVGLVVEVVSVESVDE